MATNALLKKLITLYGEPKTDDPLDFLAEYADALRGFDDATMKAAANKIAKSRMVSSWPTIGECIEACKQAEGVAKFSSVALEPIQNWDHWYSGICRDIKYASTEREIQAAIEKVRPYAMAKWCWPTRLDEVERLGDCRRSELKVKRMTGEAA